MVIFDICMVANENNELKYEDTIYDRIVIATAYSQTIADKLAYILNQIADEGYRVEVFPRNTDHEIIHGKTIGVMTND